MPDNAVSHAEDEAIFGDGEMPDELDRFNLGAYLLPFLWTLGHGVWRPALALVGLTAAGIAWFRIGSGVGVREDLSWLTYVWWAGHSLLASVGSLVALYVARRGNALSWAAQSRGRRRRGGEGESVGRFLERQWTWLVVGAALCVYGIGFDVWRGFVGDYLYTAGLWWVGMAIESAFLAVAVAWWHRDSKRPTA